MTDSKSGARAASSGKTAKKAAAPKSGRTGQARAPQNPTSVTSTTPLAKDKTPAPAAQIGSAKTEVSKTHEDLRLKELIETVAKRTDIKKNQVKKVTAALLEELGRAIETSREINLRDLGRIKYQRIIEKPDAKITVARIKRKST